MERSSINQKQFFFKLTGIFLITVLIITLLIGYYWRTLNPRDSQILVSLPSQSPIASPITNESKPSPIFSIPSSFKIQKVPFQPQAPYGDWSEKYNEACEEASIIIVKYFYGSQNLTADNMNAEINNLVEWQNQYWGGQENLTLEKTLELAESTYGVKGKILKNIEIGDIKREIAKGHPIIIPTSGRDLGNPYFRTPGPVYHMVVGIGYSENSIIVQDVGTKYGQDYAYSQKVLYNAIHDWTGDQNSIKEGLKNILVLSN